MRIRLIRPLLVFEFLVALQVVFTFWSQVGGQYHLDIMFWPWKFGLAIASALLITGITWELAKPQRFSRRAIVLCWLLFAVIVTAGVVTFYYHVNEPGDEDESDDQPAAVTRILTRRGTHYLPAPSASRPYRQMHSEIRAYSIPCH